MNHAEGARAPGVHMVGRRRFLGYVLAGATLVTAADLVSPPIAAADEDISASDLTDVVDLNDVMTLAAKPTSNLIRVEVHDDGTVSFALPRAEVGQGITTSTAMLIAEEMDLPIDRVRVTLADARPELVFNQLTGASNTTISTCTPIRIAAAIARLRLMEAAATELGADVGDLVLEGGRITDGSGQGVDIGDLVEKAASVETQQVDVELKSDADFTVVGQPQNRIDALEAVTGRKKFAMDLDVEDALPTMVCRAPTINGTVDSVANADEVRSMPGVTDVATISTGVAVRADTFGQCMDAVRALDVSWNPGTVDGQSDEDVLQELEDAELPMVSSPPGQFHGGGEVHLLLPQQQRVGTQLRDRRRAVGQRRGLVGVESSGRRPAGDRREDRPPAQRRHRARHRERRLLRAETVLRCR